MIRIRNTRASAIAAVALCVACFLAVALIAVGV